MLFVWPRDFLRSVPPSQVAIAAFAGLDALVEWMSCQLVATAEAADAAARADIIAVLRNFAENLAAARQGPRGSAPSVQDSPMDFERAEREGGPLMKALLWLARSQKPAHRWASSSGPAPRHPSSQHHIACRRPLLCISQGLTCNICNRSRHLALETHGPCEGQCR